MTKKKLILIFVIIAAVVIAGYFMWELLWWASFEFLPIFPNNTIENNTNEWKNYRNEVMGFEIKYPKGFDIEGGESNVGFKRNPNALLSIFVNPNFGLEGTKKIGTKTYNIGDVTTEADILIDNSVYNSHDPSKYIVANVKRDNNDFVFKAVFPVDDSESERIFNQILSTFKFLK